MLEELEEALARLATEAQILTMMLQQAHQAQVPQTLSAQLKAG